MNRRILVRGARDLFFIWLLLYLLMYLFDGVGRTLAVLSVVVIFYWLDEKYREYHHEKFPEGFDGRGNGEEEKKYFISSFRSVMIYVFGSIAFFPAMLLTIAEVRSDVVSVLVAITILSMVLDYIAAWPAIKEEVIQNYSKNKPLPKRIKFFGNRNVTAKRIIEIENEKRETSKRRFVWAVLFSVIFVLACSLSDTKEFASFSGSLQLWSFVGAAFSYIAAMFLH